MKETRRSSFPLFVCCHCVSIGQKLILRSLLTVLFSLSSQVQDADLEKAMQILSLS